MLERLSQGPWHRLDTADAIRRFDGPSLQNARSRRSHQQNCRRPQSRSDRMRSRMQANWASQKARQPGIHGLAQLLYQLHSPADEHGFCTASCPNDHEQTLSAATIIRFDSSGRLRAYSWLHGRRWQPRQVAEPQSIMHPTRCLQDLLRTASTYRKQHLMNISCSQVVFS